MRVAPNNRLASNMTILLVHVNSTHQCSTVSCLKKGLHKTLDGGGAGILGLPKEFVCQFQRIVLRIFVRLLSSLPVDRSYVAHRQQTTSRNS